MNRSTVTTSQARLTDLSKQLDVLRRRYGDAHSATVAKRAEIDAALDAMPRKA